MNSVIKHNFNSLWAVRECSNPSLLQEPHFLKDCLKKKSTSIESFNL